MKRALREGAGESARSALAGMANDPYFVVKANVEQAVHGLENLLQRWRDILTDDGDGDDREEEFSWLGNELTQGLQDLDWDLQDLDESISCVGRAAAVGRAGAVLTRRGVQRRRVRIWPSST